LSEIAALLDSLRSDIEKSTAASINSLRSDMGFIYESTKRSDLAATGLYSPRYLKPVNIRSLYELMSLVLVSTVTGHELKASEMAIQLANTIMEKNMHGQFIASVKILKALFNSSTVNEFLSQRLPDICASPRAHGVEKELQSFAEEIVKVYSRKGIPDSNGYKQLIVEASSLVAELEDIMEASSANPSDPDGRVLQHIVFKEHLGMMMLSTCLFKLDKDVHKRPIVKTLEFDMRGSGMLYPFGNGEYQLTLDLVEIKSRDPSKYAVRKAAKQLYERIFTIAFAANACGVSHCGICSGTLHTSFPDEESRDAAILELRDFKSRPWKHDLPGYTFNVNAV